MKELRKILGKRIKEIRLSQNLTQEGLAELIGVDWKTISRIEIGHSFPSKTLIAIANALRITLPELFDFEHLKEDIQTQKKYIAENIYNYPDDKVTIIYRMMKAMR